MLEKIGLTNFAASTKEAERFALLATAIKNAKNGFPAASAMIAAGLLREKDVGYTASSLKKMAGNETGAFFSRSLFAVLYVLTY